MSVRDPRRSGILGTLGRPGAAAFSKYDLLLLLVPLSLLAGTMAGLTSSLPTPTGAGIGSLFAALAVAYGLFVESPVDPR